MGAEKAMLVHSSNTVRQYEVGLLMVITAMFGFCNNVQENTSRMTSRECSNDT